MKNHLYKPSAQKLTSPVPLARATYALITLAALILCLPISEIDREITGWAPKIFLCLISPIFLATAVLIFLTVRAARHTTTPADAERIKHAFRLLSTSISTLLFDFALTFTLTYYYHLDYIVQPIALTLLLILAFVFHYRYKNSATKKLSAKTLNLSRFTKASPDTLPLKTRLRIWTLYYPAALIFAFASLIILLSVFLS